MNKRNRYLKLFLSFSVLFGLAGCSKSTADTGAAKTKSTGISAETEKTDSDETTAEPTEEAVNKDSYAYEVSQDPDYSPYHPDETDYSNICYGDGTEYPYVPQHFDNGIGKTAYDLNTDGLTLYNLGGLNMDEKRERYEGHITEYTAVEVKELKGPFKVIVTNKDTGEQTLVLGMESNGFLKTVLGGYLFIFVPEPGDYYIDGYVGPDTISDYSEFDVDSAWNH